MMSYDEISWTIVEVTTMPYLAMYHYINVY